MSDSKSIAEKLARQILSEGYFIANEAVRLEHTTRIIEPVVKPSEQLSVMLRKCYEVVSAPAECSPKAAVEIPRFVALGVRSCASFGSEHPARSPKLLPCLEGANL
jgi:hypothetical protein